MASTSSIDARDMIREHQAALKRYASRALVHGESLEDADEVDKDHRMEELMALGNSLKLTKREIVDLVLGELFVVRRGCGCPTCRSRSRV